MINASAGQIRILIIDDHLVVRAGLRLLIENETGMKVVGMASNRSEALKLAAQELPNLMLLDLDLGVENGLDFLSELHEQAPNARVLVLTGIRDTEAHRQAVKQGAIGVVLKDETAEVLIKAIEKVHAGEVWLNRSTMGTLINEMSRMESDAEDPEEAKIRTLTERERQVIELIAEGLKNKQIGERLFISESTVTHHLSSVFSKLGVSDRLELVIYALGHKIAQMPR